MTDAPAIVVVATAPRPGLANARLAPLLGADGAAALQATLIARAGRWAREHAAPGAAFMAYAPHDAREEVAAAGPDGLEPFAQAEGHVGARLEHAFAEAARRGGGRPVLLVGTDMSLLGERHAWSACDDLAAGVDVTYGPATDGGYYLIGARAPHPALFAIDPKAWGGPTVMTRSLDAALAAGLRVAWLRSERPLDRPADVRALLADPCAPRDVTDVLAAFSSRAPAP